MEQVLAAERSAVEAIAASQRRVDELVQAARIRARRIAERARARVAALEGAVAADGGDPSEGNSARHSAEPVLSADEQACLVAALAELADHLLVSGDAGS
jgi:cell division septum initiation protein DivIVA